MSLANKEWVAGDQVLATDLNGQFQGKKDTQKAGETINGATLPVPVYFYSTDSEWYACDANVATKLEFAGFAITNGTDGNNIDIQFNGVVSGFSGLTVGAKYYVQDTVGTIGTSIGTYEILVGIALSATEVLIQRGSMEYMGSASGTNSSPITVPSAARFAIIAGSASMSGHSSSFSSIIARVGGTSISFDDDHYAPAETLGLDASWSGNQITLSLRGSATSCSMSAYFFR